MALKFPRGKITGQEDLTINLLNAQDLAIDPYEIFYALYDVTTGVEVLLGSSERAPVREEKGLYYAAFQIPEDANLGLYRLRWFFRETTTSQQQMVLQEFNVLEESDFKEDLYNVHVLDMVRRLRILLRDNCIGEEEVVDVLTEDGEIIEVSFLELWGLLHDV